MRLTMHLLLVGLLTGVVLEPAQAGEGGCDCPPGPPGGPHFGPPTFDRRVGPGGGDEHFKPPMPLAELDQNKDGRVTRSEIDRELRERFAAADADRNGTLDPEEFEHARTLLPEGAPGFFGPMTIPAPPPDGDDGPPLPPPGFARQNRAWGPPDPARLFKHLDWNLDGELSFEEFAAPVRQIAMRLDRNGDGVVEQDELKGPVFVFGPGFGPPPRPPRDR